MKVFNVIEIEKATDAEHSVSWRVLPDSVIMKGRNPFFVPEFDCPICAYAAVALRVSRLGKYVESRFAGRYFSEMAPAVVFHADALGERLRSLGLPDDEAYCFDQAVALGNFTDAMNGAESLSLRLRSGEREEKRTADNPAQLFAEAVEVVSRRNTIKMGDIILCTLTRRGLPVTPDTFTEASVTVSGNNINHCAELRLTVK